MIKKISIRQHLGAQEETLSYRNASYRHGSRGGGVGGELRDGHGGEGRDLAEETELPITVRLGGGDRSVFSLGGVQSLSWDLLVNFVDPELRWKIQEDFLK